MNENNRHENIKDEGVKERRKACIGSALKTCRTMATTTFSHGKHKIDYEDDDEDEDEKAGASNLTNLLHFFCAVLTTCPCLPGRLCS